MKRRAETLSKKKSRFRNSHYDSLQRPESATDLWRPAERAGGIGQGNALLAQAEVCQDDVAL